MAVDKRKSLSLGCLDSTLAVAQTQMVAEYLRVRCPRTEITVVPTPNVEEALRQDKCDVLVHDLREMPLEIPEDLPILGYSEREDPRDVLVLPEGAEKPNPNLPLGCASQRRILQLHKLFPRAIIKDVQGDIKTRLNKLANGEYGGLILAASGLKKLELEERISRYFTIEEIIPAVGQGILAVQARAEEDYSQLEEFFCRDSYWAAEAERSFARTLGETCSESMAAFAQVEEKRMQLTGLYYDKETGKSITGNIQGLKADARRMGESLARNLRANLV